MIIDRNMINVINLIINNVKKYGYSVYNIYIQKRNEIQIIPDSMVVYLIKVMII